MIASASGTPHGLAIEDRARQVAARLGLADFVYRAELVRRGGGNREPGDAILYANGRGAIIQVKSRAPEAAKTDTTLSRVQKWIDKYGMRAYNQGTGTRRQLARRRDSGSPVIAVPVRASHLDPADQQKAALLLDMDVENWPTVVVIDHPGATGTLAPSVTDAFWITLSNWGQLHRAIRSTTGMLDYVYRVLASSPSPRWTLGTEERRFDAVVLADRKFALAGGPLSRPILDYSTLQDPLGAELYRDILERVWPEDGSLPRVQIADYRLLMEHLDGIPPSAAAELGRWILGKRHRLDELKTWISGAFLMDDRLTVYACDHADNYSEEEGFVARLLALTQTRGLEASEQLGADVQCAAIGVLQGEDYLDYQYALAIPPFGLSRKVRVSIELQLGILDMATGSCRPLRLGRNDQCPCGSGRKFKHCCGGRPREAGRGPASST